MSTTATKPNWTTATLAEIAEIERSAVSPENIQSGTTYVGLENITGDGGFVNVGTVANGELASTKFRFTPSHILYGKLRPYLAKIARPDFEGVCSTDILPILPGPNVDQGYLLHFLRQPHMVAFASSRTSGANLPRLSPSELASFEVPLPPLKEQKQIADILDKADGIRRKRRDALTYIDRLIQSEFLRTVGPMADGFETWTELRIEDLAASRKGAMRTGPFGSTLKHSEFVESGIAVLGIDNAVRNRFGWDQRRFITQDKYAELQSYRVHPGDVLVTIMGTIGRSAVVPDDIPLAINTKHLACITVDRSKAEPEFLAHAIHRHPDVLRQLNSAGRGAIMTGLNLGIIKRINLRVPPLKLQREFTDVLAKLRVVEDRMTASHEQVEELFSSLVTRAFKGEL